MKVLLKLSLLEGNSIANYIKTSSVSASLFMYSPLNLRMKKKVYQFTYLKKTLIFIIKSDENTISWICLVKNSTG